MDQPVVSQGPNLAGLGFSDASSGNYPWAYPGNILFSDSKFAASGYFRQDFTSHYLKATNFGFSIPENVTINGIEVFVMRKSPSSAFRAKDFEVKLFDGNSYVGENKADTTTPWPDVTSEKTYGGQSDLWGITPTALMVNNGLFGIGIRAKRHDTQGFACIDSITMKIYFS